MVSFIAAFRTFTRRSKSTKIVMLLIGDLVAEDQKSSKSQCCKDAVEKPSFVSASKDATRGSWHRY